MYFYMYCRFPFQNKRLSNVWSLMRDRDFVQKWLAKENPLSLSVDVKDTIQCMLIVCKDQCGSKRLLKFPSFTLVSDEVSPLNHRSIVASRLPYIVRFL